MFSFVYIFNPMMFYYYSIPPYISTGYYCLNLSSINHGLYLYHHPEGHCPPPPVTTADTYSLHPVSKHGYTNLPPLTVGDSPSPHRSPSLKDQGQFNRLRQRKLEKWKRYTRILKLVSQIVTPSSLSPCSALWSLSSSNPRRLRT